MQKWTKCYKEQVLQQKTPPISSADGSLLTIAQNTPKFEATYRTQNPNAEKLLSTKRTEIISCLQANKAITPSSQIPFKNPENGVCLGMSMEFIRRFFEAPDGHLQSKLLYSAQQFECRSGITAVALHSIYAPLIDSIMDDPCNIKACRSFYSVTANTPDATARKKRSECDQTAIALLFKSLGHKYLGAALPASLPGDLSEQEYLSQWLKEADGIFDVSIKVSDGYHAFVLAKETLPNGIQEVYLWDTDHGLIQCSSQNPVTAIINFLSKCYPGVPNHQLDIRRVQVA